MPVMVIVDALRALRNGAWEGVRIRLPHAMVVMLLYGRGTVAQRVTTALRLTREHSWRLGVGALVYRLVARVLALAHGHNNEPWHFAVAGLVGSAVAWSRPTAVTRQMLLYLLPRALFALGRVALRRGWVPSTTMAHVPFETLACIVLATALYLFEAEPDAFPGALRASLTYIYKSC